MSTAAWPSQVRQASGMATSSKSRVKSASAHSKASPSARDTRARSSSRPLPEKVSRDQDARRSSRPKSPVVSSRRSSQPDVRARSDGRARTMQDLAPRVVDKKRKAPVEIHSESDTDASSSDAIQVVVVARKRAKPVTSAPKARSPPPPRPLPKQKLDSVPRAAARASLFAASTSPLPELRTQVEAKAKAKVSYSKARKSTVSAATKLKQVSTSTTIVSSPGRLPQPPAVFPRLAPGSSDETSGSDDDEVVVRHILSPVKQHLAPVRRSSPPTQRRQISSPPVARQPLRPPRPEAVSRSPVANDTSPARLSSATSQSSPPPPLPIPAPVRSRSPAVRARRRRSSSASSVVLPPFVDKKARKASFSPIPSVSPIPQNDRHTVKTVSSPKFEPEAIPTHFDEPDIAVPEYESPRVSESIAARVSPIPELPAKSKGISRKRLSKQEDRKEPDIPVPREYDGSDDDFEHFMRRSSSPPEETKPDIRPRATRNRPSDDFTSDRARKSTGGRRPAVRRTSRRRSPSSEYDSDKNPKEVSPSGSEIDDGDTGAIVSSLEDARSEDQRKQLRLRPARQSRRESSELPPAKPAPRRSLPREQSRLSSRVQQPSRTTIVSVEVPRSKAPRHSSATYRPTRPSKSARSINGRVLFEADGSSRRRSLNDRFSDEDSNDSDAIEVMKSSTLEKGLTATDTLRMASLERNARRSTSSVGDPITNDEAGRASSPPAGPTREDSEELPPPLKSSQSRAYASTSQTRHVEEEPLMRFSKSRSPPGGPPELAAYDLPFPEVRQDRAESMDTRQASASIRSVPEPDFDQRLVHDDTRFPHAPTSKSMPRPHPNSLLPQEVVDAVSAAVSRQDSSSSNRSMSRAGKSRRGPTPASGRRKHRENEEDFEADDVIVRDSAIVMDPHGRMMRKEELLAMMAEHGQQSSSKGKERASSWLDADGSDEEVGGPVAGPDGFADHDDGMAVDPQQPGGSRVDIELNHSVVTAQLSAEGLLDDEREFHLSIARLDFHIEEMDEHDGDTDRELFGDDAVEGIVEELEDDFWDDEAELLLATHLLKRIASRQLRQRPLNEPDASRAHQAVPEPQASTSAIRVSQTPVPAAASEPVRAELTPSAGPASQRRRETPSARPLSPAARTPSPSRNVRFSEGPLEIPAGEEAQGPIGHSATSPSRGRPSKFSPTKNRNSASPFKQASPARRLDGVLQTAPREGDEELVIEDEPDIAPSIFIRSQHVAPHAQQGSEKARRTIAPNDVMEQAGEQAEPSNVLDSAAEATDHLLPFGMPEIASTPRQLTPQRPRRSNRSSNVVVEITTPPSSTKKSVAKLPNPGPHTIQSSMSPTSAPDQLREMSIEMNLDPEVEVEDQEVRNLVDEHRNATAQQSEPLIGAAESLDLAAARARSASIAAEIDAIIEQSMAEMEDAMAEDPSAPVVQAEVTRQAKEGRTRARTTTPPTTAQPRVTATSPRRSDRLALAAQSAVANIESTAFRAAESSGSPPDEVFARNTAQPDAQESKLGGPSNTLPADEADTSASMAADTSQPHAEAGAPSTHSITASVAVRDGSTACPQEGAPSAETPMLHASTVPKPGSSSAADTTSSSDADGPSSVVSDDAEGDEEIDLGSEKPFRLPDLLQWAEELQDSGKPHLIGAAGFEAMFDQMKLSMEGPLPLLLAWKLGCTVKGECAKVEFISLLREAEVDTPAKLSAYLSNLRDSTFAISTHIRYPSLHSEEEGETAEPIKTLRIPEVYKSFYEFCFDYMKPDRQAVSIPKEHARNLWWVVMAPCLAIGRALVDFIDADRWSSEIAREDWRAMLDMAGEVASDAAETSALAPVAVNGSEGTFGSTFRQWQLARIGATAV